MTSSEWALNAIKMVHTVVWAFFVSCIAAIFFFAWQAQYGFAALMIGIVLIEVVVLALNRWRCPLTSVAGRYTDDRRANFDIYLPAWLAGNNKLIFSALYVAGIALTLARLAYETS
jgi:membrane-bound metal-dependent hydrolase YbcI (DUF457 family)